MGATCTKIPLEGAPLVIEIIGATGIPSVRVVRAAAFLSLYILRFMKGNDLVDSEYIIDFFVTYRVSGRRLEQSRPW